MSEWALQIHEIYICIKCQVQYQDTRIYYICIDLIYTNICNILLIYNILHIYIHIHRYIYISYKPGIAYK
jgi:hypothetical protein